MGGDADVFEDVGRGRVVDASRARGFRREELREPEVRRERNRASGGARRDNRLGHAGGGFRLRRWRRRFGRWRGNRRLARWRLNFGGGSIALDPFGRTLAELPALATGVTVAELSAEVLRRARAAYPLLRDENIELVHREMSRIRQSRFHLEEPEAKRRPR